MKRFLLTAVALLTLGGTGFSQMMMMEDREGNMPMMGMQPYYPMGGMMGMMPMMMMPMMPMMGMGGMGMMGMMQDPETMRIVRKHMMKCRKELMQKLAKRPTAMAERMLRMMAMHPEAFKEALEKNPELKEKLRELLK